VAKTVRPSKRHGGGVVGVPSATEPAPGAQEKKYAWTIMLYLAGDNNLSDEMVWALKEVYRVGTPEGIAVTLQFDPLARGSSTRFFLAPSSGQAIDVDGIFPILHDEDLPEVDDGDPDTVAEFVVRSMKAAPARYYMLILAGHGSGIVGDFLTETDQAGSPRPSSLTIPLIGLTLRRLQSRLEEEGLQREGLAIDVLGLDSCLMSMAEISSEVEGEVAYLVGSEGFDPNAGWPYFRLLEELRARPKGQLPDPKELADLLVRMYILYYSDYSDADVSVDMSACDVGTGRVRAIEEAVAPLVGFYLEHEADPLIRNAVVMAHWKAQSYKWEVYTDLADFCDLLQNECTNLLRAANGTSQKLSKLIDICQAIVKSVDEAVMSCDSSGPEFQYSYGLSVYFPWSRAEYEDDYRSTRFAARTGWDRFLERYVDGTRRPRRRREAVGGKPSQTPSGPKQPSVKVTGGRIDLIDSRVTRPARPTWSAGGARSRQPSSFFSTSAAPPAATNELSATGNVPSARANAPSNRANAPSNRANAPSNRANAPSNRFAQYIGSVMNELPSRMKNPATDAEPIVAFTEEDRKIVRQFKARAPKPSPSPSDQPSRPKPAGYARKK
jgi:hypothetical protein